jgi:integrase
MIKVLETIRVEQDKEKITTEYSKFVFLSNFGKPMKSVKKSFKTALLKSQITDFRFHDLRHTFASHYVMNCGDLMSLKEILGHSNLKMVERYSHLAAAYKRKMINNLNGKFLNCQIFAKNQEIGYFGQKNNAL